jgi:hypothetical protein
MLSFTRGPAGSDFGSEEAQHRKEWPYLKLDATNLKN